MYRLINFLCGMQTFKLCWDFENKIDNSNYAKKQCGGWPLG